MKYRRHLVLSLVGWSVAAMVLFGLDHMRVVALTMPSGMGLLCLLGVLAASIAATNLLALGTQVYLAARKHPAVEGVMVGRLYALAAAIAVGGVLAYGFGKLALVGTAFGMFGGMLLGWSLQAPVSGFAAWVLVSIKRPFRPGDRVQFPSLSITGDVEDVGPMYTVLDQVGGSIGSEEAVGRSILVPNAMLFSQVIINYTVTQEAAHMLDEQTVRITFDSDWEAAEKLLVTAATEATGDIIEATRLRPYIRCDLYDYGVMMRLRYQTRVQDRTEIQYEITKRIFKGIQGTRKVDMAIPYIYSYRAGSDQKDDGPGKGKGKNVEDLPVGSILLGTHVIDPHDVEQVAHSIAAQGLLQPIVVVKSPKGGTGGYDLLAGAVRLAACKKLGWETIPAIVLDHRPDEAE